MAPRKPLSRQPNRSNSSDSIPARATINTADTQADEIEKTAPAQVIADKESTPPVGTNANVNRSTSLSRADLSKKVELIRIDIDCTTRVMSLIPDRLDGPLAILVQEVRRINCNMTQLSSVMANLCNIKDNKS